MTTVLPYRSFWMGGFEGADHRNSHGTPLDMAAACGHLQRLDEDYALAASLGLRSVRESLGWRLSETRPGHWDFSRAERIAAAARRHGVQVLWSLMHYGTPPDVSLLDDAFIDRYAAFCAAAARALGALHDDRSEERPVYTPINEIGFLAWAVSETNLIAPYRRAPDGNDGSSLHSGWDVKRRLVRGAIAGMHAMRAVDPRARFLHIEPLVHVAAPTDRPDLQPLADTIAGYQWQVWDLLSGRLEPGLGGNDAMLDLVGVNHYASGQWEALSEDRLAWNPPDPRRRPPRLLLRDAASRYGKPLLVAETSNVGEDRADWLRHITSEVAAARADGTPVAGICLYPLVDRPDWDRTERWHRSGVIDVVPPRPGATEHGAGHERQPHPASMAALVRCQRDAATPQRQQQPLLPTLLVRSHRPWNGPYGRLQQLLSRLARWWDVAVVEPDAAAETGPGAALAPGIVRMRRPAQAGCDILWCTDGSDDAVLPLLADMERPPRAVVLDCSVPPSAALLRAADLVLAAGPSLAAALHGRHPNVHCLPNAVDASFHDPARLLPGCAEAVAASALLDAVPAPRLLHAGAIDERVDLALLAAAADARPSWHWVLIGPASATPLPQRANLHWLGPQPYAVLPYVAAACDACVLPWSVDAATCLANPLQTLEWLAAARPVVTTAIPDVRALYGDAVLVADGAEAFIAACGRALTEPPPLVAMRRHAVACTWDAQAGAARALLMRALVDG